jgi:hypothetical protein
MALFIVASFRQGETVGRAQLVDGVSGEFASEQPPDDHPVVYVVPEDKARLFREKRSRDEVPVKERPPAS